MIFNNKKNDDLINNLNNKIQYLEEELLKRNQLLLEQANKISDKQQEINRIRAQVREQTEADLLLISIKIISDILKEKNLEQLDSIIEVQKQLISSYRELKPFILPFKDWMK